MIVPSWSTRRDFQRRRQTHRITSTFLCLDVPRSYLRRGRILGEQGVLVHREYCRSICTGGHRDIFCTDKVRSDMNPYGSRLRRIVRKYQEGQVYVKWLTRSTDGIHCNGSSTVYLKIIQRSPCLDLSIVSILRVRLPFLRNNYETVCDTIR